MHLHPWTCTVWNASLEPSQVEFAAQEIGILKSISYDRNIIQVRYMTPRRAMQDCPSPTASSSGKSCAASQMYAASNFLSGCRLRRMVSEALLTWPKCQL